MTRLVIFGGRGGGTIVASSVRRISASGGALDLAGFLNDTMPAGTSLEGSPVLGSFADWKRQPDDMLFVAPLHKPKAMLERSRRILELGVPANRWATVVDPLAVVAEGVAPGAGSCIDCRAAIMPGARIGTHVAVRCGAVVSHDAEIEDFAFVGVNAVVCGYATVGTGAHVAPGAVIQERTRIGRYAVVGLGAVTVRDVPDYAIVVGNPGRVIGFVEDQSTRAS
jgi:acetyltransferase EpsM